MRNEVNRALVAKKNKFQSKTFPQGTRTIWRYLSAFILFFALSIGQMWGADVAFTAGSNTAIAKKVSTSSPLLYMVRGGGGATYTTDYGIQLKTDLIFVFTLDAAADVRINLKSKDTNNAGRDNKFKLYSLNSKKAGFLKILEYSATNNAKLDASYGALKASDSDVTDFSSTSISNANYCSIDNNPAVNSIIGSELTIHTDKNSPADGTFSSVAAGTYVLFCSAAPTTNVCIASITFTSSAATAPAITAPTTDQSASYTVGDVISALEVTATGSPAPTYQWYYNSSASTEGATSLGSGAQTASYTPSSAAESDLYYYCVATNSAGSATSPYFHVTVSTPSTPTHDITYTNTKGADNSANPIEYYEGIGVASFEPLADVTGFHFNGWSPASIEADATTDQTISATWVDAYNVTFALGTGASGSAPAGFQKWEGAKFNLPGQGDMVAPSGKVFDGWKASGTKYAANAEYTMGNAAVEFVAQWKAVPQTIYSLTVTNTSSVNLNNGGAQNDLADDATIVGGGAYMQNDHASSAQQILGSTKLQFKAGTITLVMTLNNALKEGDTIKATGLNSEGLCFGVTFDRAGSLDNQLASDASYFIVPEGFEGKTTLYAWRHSGSGTTCASIIIRRPAERPVASTVITLSDVKVNEASISAANLATLVADHSLALSDEFAAAPVIKFNEHTVITYDDELLPATKVTDKVYTVTATVNGDGKWQASQTINSVAYTVTAEKVSSAKVYYYDGATKLGEEIVGIGDSPVNAGNYDDKDLYSFVGWYNNADLAEEHKIADIAALVVTKDTTVYGKWNPAYATSINIEQWVLDNGIENAPFRAELTARHYKYATLNNLDSLNDDPSKDYRNYAYLGQKVNKTDSEISFLLKNGSTLKVRFGHLGSTINVVYGTDDPIALTSAEYANESPAGDKVYEYTATADVIVKFQCTGTSTSVFKQIMIDEDIAAVTLPWRVTYNAGTGTCATAEAIWSGAALILPDVTPAEPADYTFAGWYDGEDFAGAAGASYNATKNVTLLAQFAPKEYAIAYDGNGATSGSMSAGAAGWGTMVTPAANAFEKTGHVFNGWEITKTSDGSATGITFSAGKFEMPKYDVTLVAQWEDATYAAQIGSTPYATLEDALLHAADGTIELLRNINTESQIEILSGVTAVIDLAGHKIEYTGTTTLSSGVILVHNNASLTINDSSDPDAGSIVAGTKAYAAIALTKAGDDASKPATLTINGGIFTGTYYAITGHGSRHNTVTTINGGTFSATAKNDNLGIFHQQEGTLTINGGSFTGYASAIEMRAGTLVINDGTFTATASTYSCNPAGSGNTTVGAAIAIAQHTTKKDIAVTINGGTFNGVKAINEANPQGNPSPAITMSVTGGDFTGEVSTVDVNNFISGGTFDAAVAIQNCADGYVPAEADLVTGKYSVEEGWKVTFVDGEDAEIVAVGKNTPVAEKAVAGKIGYAFDGWYNGADLYDFTANVTSDLMLNAQWTAFAGCADLWPATSGETLSAGDVVDLQTGSAGGSIVASTTNISYGEYGLLLASSSSTYVTVTLNNDMVENTKITVVLAAGGTSERGVNIRAAVGTTNVHQMKWTPAAIGEEKSFEYTLDSESALKDKNIFYLYRNGNVYIKSVRVESCGDVIVYHNLTSAVVPADKGTVTLGASTVRVGHTTTAEYTITDPLYEFVSWSVSGEGASIADASANPATITMGTEDAVVTLNLQLIPEKFTVNYYDGSTPMGTEDVELNANPTAAGITTAKRHYTFQGWAETDGGSVVALNTITSDVIATISLYAVYAPVACPTSGYLFSMESDEAKKPAETVVAAKDGGKVELADYATISGGNAFIQNDETSNKDAISTSGQFLLKATKEYMKIELNCVLQEGDIIRIPDNNQKYVISTSNAKSGTYQAQTSSQHEFAVTAAWAGVDDIYILYDGSSLNFTKVYVYRPAKFTVSFNLKGHGSAAVADLTDVLEGSKITAPTAPTDEDYAFAGWYKETELENAWDFDNDVVSANTTLYAKWIDNTDATLKWLKYGTTEIELEDGVYDYNIGLPNSTPSVPALDAQTTNPNATAVIFNVTEFDAEDKATSTVTVNPVSGSSQVYTVNFTKLAELPQVDVTASTLWDFSLAGSTSLTNQTDIVLANLPGINNDATFNSQALKGTFNKLPGGYFQGSKLMFNVAEDGLLTIGFRGTNNNARHLQVCVGDGETVIADWAYSGSGSEAHQIKSIEVPAGKVTLKAFEGEGAQNVRIYNLEYLTLAHSRTSGYAAGDLGTVCLEDATIIDGANLYELAGLDKYGYLAFDQITSGELEAGKPYLFEVTNPSKVSFYKPVGAAHSDTEIETNGMIGTFTGTTLYQNAAQNYYYFSGRHIWRVNDFTVSIPLGAHRCYVDMDVLKGVTASSNPAPGRSRVLLGVNGAQVATGMENAQSSETSVQKILINGEMYILRGEKMYDATGRLVK
jgi:uncharacterized repeat protein (TIGR02543 family)